MAPAKTVRDGVILDALADALEAGETDLADGGVPPCVLADRLGYKRHAMRDRLVDLADDGDLREVQGLDPETMRPRRSFLPTDHD